MFVFSILMTTNWLTCLYQDLKKNYVELTQKNKTHNSSFNHNFYVRLFVMICAFNISFIYLFTSNQQQQKKVITFYGTLTDQKKFKIKIEKKKEYWLHKI